MQNAWPVKTGAKWLQSGVVTGLAMRILCFAVIQCAPGIDAPPVQDCSFSARLMCDRVEQQFVRVEKMAAEMYDKLRFAYQVAQRLRELERNPAALPSNELMRGSRLLLAGPWPAHEKGKRCQTSNHGGHDPEAVFKAQRAGLLLNGLIGKGKRLFRRSDCVVALCDKELLQAGQKLGKVAVCMARVCSKHSQMGLVLTRQKSGEQRSAYTAANIAREIGEPGNLVILLARNADVV